MPAVALERSVTLLLLRAVCFFLLFIYFVDLFCLVRVLNIKSFKSESSFPEDWLPKWCCLRCVSVMVVAQHHHMWPLCVKLHNDKERPPPQQEHYVSVEPALFPV